MDEQTDGQAHIEIVEQTLGGQSVVGYTLIIVTSTDITGQFLSNYLNTKNIKTLFFITYE